MFAFDCVAILMASLSSFWTLQVILLSLLDLI